MAERPGRLLARRAARRLDALDHADAIAEAERRERRPERAQMIVIGGDDHVHALRDEAREARRIGHRRVVARLGVHVEVGARDALQLDHALRAERLDADLVARARS